MIKLTPGDPPDNLTAEFIREKTERFNRDPKAVWNYPWLREALMAVSHGKCCYSECRLGESGSYMEVEHFHPKSLYPDEVLVWENLLPSSKTCNASKGDWDTKVSPIIHPYQDDPRDHLSLKAFRFYQKTQKGQRTIEATGVNDRLHFATPRARLAFEVLDDLEEFAQQCTSISPTDAQERSRLLQQKLTSRLRRGRREEPFAAVIATSILTNPHFNELR